MICADKITDMLPSPHGDDGLLVLHEIVRCRVKSGITPEIRFLADLAIRNPASLRQIDIEQLAEAMIAWGQRHTMLTDRAC